MPPAVGTHLVSLGASGWHGEASSWEAELLKAVWSSPFWGCLWSHPHCVAHNVPSSHWATEATGLGVLGSGEVPALGTEFTAKQLVFPPRPTHLPDCQSPAGAGPAVTEREEREQGAGSWHGD